MKRIFASLSVVVLGVVFLLGACAPKASPPAPAPSRPPPSATVAPASSTLSPEQTAWAKVTEAAKQEGAVVGFTAGTLTSDAVTAIGQAFKERYGITVEFISGTSGAQVERARTELAAGKKVTDWMIQSQTTLLNVIGEGLLQPWGDLPVFAEKEVWFFPPKYDTDSYIVSYGKYWMVPYVNTQLVKPEDELKSYLDMLKPQWTGKLNIIDPSGGVGPPVMYASLKYYKALDADDFFRQLGKQKVRIATSYPEQATQVAQGLVHGAVAIQEAYTNRFLAEGSPIKPLYMKEGVTLRNLLGISLLKNAPHPNATRVFMNWLLSKEGQTVFARSNKTSPSRKDVEDFSLVSKIIAPQAKVYFVQNKDLDLEIARVQREDVISRLMGFK